MKLLPLKRIKVILIGGISRVLVSFSSVIISFVVIRTQYPDLWGEAVVYILMLDLGFSIVSWGSTPYLIREFSLHPAKIPIVWGTSVSSRIVLLVSFLGLLFLLLPHTSILLWVILWAVARYIYQSFETYVQYERQFLFSFITELIALAVVIVPVIAADTPLQTENLIILLCLSTVIKASFSVIFFWRKISFLPPRVEFFKHAFPFLLLTFSAMAQQRADLYCVAYFLPKIEVARYQVFLNLLIFSQFGASLLLSPFAKNIFRLPHVSFLKMEKQFATTGIFLSALSLVAVFLVSRFVYKLEYSLLLFALGYFYILMFYLYLLRNYLLGKQNKQTKAAVYSFIASGANAILSILFTPRFGLEGALAAGLAAQVLLVALYHQKFNFNGAYR